MSLIRHSRFHSFTPENVEIESDFYDMDNNIWIAITLSNGVCYIHLKQGKNDGNPQKAPKSAYVCIRKKGLAKLLAKVSHCLKDPDNLENLEPAVMDFRGAGQVLFERDQIALDEYEHDTYKLTYVHPSPNIVDATINITYLTEFRDIMFRVLPNCVKVRTP